MPPYISKQNSFLITQQTDDEETMGVHTVYDKSRETKPQHPTSFAVLREADVYLEMEEEECDDPAAGGSDDSMVDVDLSASMASLSTTPSSKKVSFTSLHIRQHSVILGDHPCCTVGLPVALGWDVQCESSISLDDYEATRLRRRSRHDLRLSLEDRRTMLSDTVSPEDVRRVQRKLHRERRCTNRAKRQFFQNPPVVDLAAGVTASE